MLKCIHDLMEVCDKGDLKAAFEICSNTLEMQKVKSTNGYDAIRSKILLSRIYSSIGETEKAAEKFRNMKQYEKAKEYAKKALELRSGIYDYDHPEIKAARMLFEKLN